MLQEEQINVDFEGQCNNIVAQSEYDAAIAAIQSTFENFQVSGRCNENENLDESLDQQLIDEVYEAAKISLLNNVKRVVRSIHDDDYSNYVDQYHMIFADESDNNVDNNGNNNMSIVQNESDDEEEEEIDEEELLDMKAWKDAQELRKRIRTMSSSVQRVRERVLKDVDDSILSSISKHLVDKPVEIVFEDTDSNNGKNKTLFDNISNDKENRIQESNIGDNEMNDDSSTLQCSLQDLSKALKDPKWAQLPKTIKSLQETIETVRKETTEDRVMSQTEIAITSRHNHKIDKSIRRKLLEQDSLPEELPSENDSVDAMDRLALFGQLFS